MARKLVVFKFLGGDFEQGFPVILQIGEEGSGPDTEITGRLPPAPAIPATYDDWQSKYRRLSLRVRLDKPVAQVTQISPVQECRDAAKRLKKDLCDWLNSETFRSIRETLLKKLQPSDEVRVIIQAEEGLQRLPWDLWDFFESYPKAEISLSAPRYERQEKAAPAGAKVRILAILGDSTGINIEADRALLEQVPDTEPVFLPEPARTEINDKLWEQSWDILFFAGHSRTEDKKGRLYINQEDSLTIDELKNGFRKAIARGLRLAIFNSCDGLGLARDLADLHLPQLIVMREPVPDKVAQEFLKYFLQEFAGGKSLHLAVHSARERLQGLEGEFPCASWMPVICQHPAEVPPTWEELRYGRNGKRGERGSRSNWVKLGAAFLASLAATSLVLGVRQLGWLEKLELKAFDQLMQVRPDEGADPRLLVVEATSEDIKKYGFPLPDGILARVIEKIGAHQPPVIGLDIYRDVPVGTGNPELVKQLQNDRLIVICQVSQVNDPGIPPPPAVTDEDRHSFSDIVTDSDGVIRRHLLVLNPNLNSPCRTDHSFSLLLALNYLYETKGIARDSTQYLKLGETVFKPLQINPDKPAGAGGYRKTDLKGYQILLNYRTFKDVARRVSISDVLTGQFDPNWVRDRIVLIGVTDPTKPDNHLTPYQTMPGVLIQAQMVSQILSAVLDKRPLLGVWPAWGETLWIWGWSFAGGALVWGWRKQLHRGVAIAGAIVILSGICYILLIQGSWVPLVPSALALAITGGIVVVYSASIKKRL